MGFIIIIPFAALAGWSIFAIFRWLRRGNFGPKWWRALALLGLAGFALGVWFAFFIQYRVANAHIEGFPIPVNFSTREKPDGPWQKSDLPVVVRAGAMLTNLLGGVALCLAPLALAAFLHENRKGTDSHAS
jgi:hypothetical protein